MEPYAHTHPNSPIDHRRGIDPRGHNPIPGNIPHATLYAYGTVQYARVYLYIELRVHVSSRYLACYLHLLRPASPARAGHLEFALSTPKLGPGCEGLADHVAAHLGLDHLGG